MTIEITVRQALKMALVDAMKQDDDVFLIGEDIADPMGGSYKITLGLSSQFGTTRVRNTPISEAAIVGTSVGAALAGMRPVAEVMFSDFLSIAMDQLVNQAAFSRYMSGGRASVPMVVRCQGGAWRSSAAQHSKTVEAWFTHVPGIRFVIPSTPSDAYWLLRWAIDCDDPVIFYESNLLYGTSGPVDVSNRPKDLDQPALRREGRDATVVTWGQAVPMTLEAAASLEASDIQVEVIDLRHLAPLNLDMVLASVRKTHLLLVVHEAWKIGGAGAEVAAQVADTCFAALDGPIRRIGARHSPHPFSPVLEEAMMPSIAAIESTVREMVTARARK